MRLPQPMLFVNALALVQSVFLGAAFAGEARVTGSVTYPDHVTLPPGAVLEVALEDVSLADAPATVIATDTPKNLGLPPFPFSLTYDPAQIDERHTYAVRARVTLGEWLLMTTDTHAPVITRDAPMQVDVILRPVSAQPDRAGQVHTAPGLTLPASFTGTMPMASGPGVDWHLDIWPDQVYHLRQTYGGGDPVYDRGRWHADPARGAIVLRGGREAPVVLDIMGNGDLRMTDTQGNRIESDLPYTLAAGPLQPAEGTQFLTGMFRHVADAARFTECLTGRSYPVLMHGAFIDAERAYERLDTQEPGDPVLAMLEGRLAVHPAMDGPDRMQLEIESFLRFEPGLTCAGTGGHAGPQDAAALTNTYWRLLEIEGEATRPVETRREPHLLLRTGEEATFGATVGCNRIRGGYETEGNTLSFATAAMTRMMCPSPLDEAERALARALERVARWQIDGTTLDLFDKSGVRVLRAEAVYLY